MPPTEPPANHPTLNPENNLTVTTLEDEFQNPTPSTSRGLENFEISENTLNKSTTQNDTFSPEAVRPFGKAPPRKVTARGKKKRKSTVYTDTPEKEEIEREANKKTQKKTEKVKRNLGTKEKGSKKIPKKAPVRIRKESSEDSDGEGERFCLVCVEPFDKSKPGEQWVRCIDCKMWSHEACTPQELPYYICHNCQSD